MPHLFILAIIALYKSKYIPGEIRLENFIYSINATLPIFAMMILGKFLVKTKIINENFAKAADKFVFYAALPALVFRDLSEADVSHGFDGKFVLFCAITTTVVILSIWGLTEIFMKDDSMKGAFIQASYRSSAAILGLAFIDNMFHGAGMAPLMIIGAVLLFNIFAVVILTLKGDNGGKKPDLKSAFTGIIKNPILIGIVVSLPFCFFDISLPAFLQKTVNHLAGTATPLALISIGATFEGRKAIRKIKPTAIATFIKLFLLAALFLPVAILLGFRNQELVAALIMLASPATPSCYIMVKNTNNDAVLTSSIIVLTTLLSSVSLTFWIYLLRTLGYI